MVSSAHKAANPAHYAVHPTAQELYPPLREIEGKHSPTKVHLQIYDGKILQYVAARHSQVNIDAAHVLPVLFAFSTPAKYCFRAMATFCKHVIEGAYDPISPPATSVSMPNMPSKPLDNGVENGAELRAVQSAPSHGLKMSRSIRRSFSVKMQRAANAMQPWSPKHKKRQQVNPPLPTLPEAQQKPARSTSDVGGPRFGGRSSPEPRDSERYAGEPTTYLNRGNEVHRIHMHNAVRLYTDNLTVSVGRTYDPRASLHTRHFAPT